jgi:hypothetical protein
MHINFEVFHVRYSLHTSIALVLMAFASLALLNRTHLAHNTNALDVLLFSLTNLEVLGGGCS